MAHNSENSTDSGAAGLKGKQPKREEPEVEEPVRNEAIAQLLDTTRNQLKAQLVQLDQISGIVRHSPSHALVPRKEDWDPEQYDQWCRQVVPSKRGLNVARSVFLAFHTGKYDGELGRGDLRIQIRFAVDKEIPAACAPIVTYNENPSNMSDLSNKDPVSAGQVKPLMDEWPFDLSTEIVASSDSRPASGVDPRELWPQFELKFLSTTNDVRSRTVYDLTYDDEGYPMVTNDPLVSRVWRVCESHSQQLRLV